MNKINFIYSLLLVFFISSTSIAQTQSQRKQITANYDIEKLLNLSQQYSELYRIEKKKAIDFALQNDIDLVVENESGEISVLQKVLDDGTPIYYTTFNVGSAVTINTDDIQAGGANGLSLTGNGLVMGIWDGGLVRMTHQELAGRVTQLDSPSGLSSHATHVSGTMIASGVNPNARGMAFDASLIAYDFNNDESEMALQAANGMLVSNHSYGLNPNSIPDGWFGAYLGFAADVDDIVYNAPNYLPVFAAGNSNNNLPPHNPSRNGYDLISGVNLAKNILCVANVIEVPNYTDSSSVQIWQSSSWGPTDDGRIKPDISAQGRLTFSSTAGADDSYASFTGTSMAAPAVSGSIGLLHEHYNNLYNIFLSAASLRALVIHTAREAGNSPGPDYIYGWGLMNTAAAADVITNSDFTHILEENSLIDGNIYSITVNAIDPNEPLTATIAWTDPAGPIQDLILANDPTPRLVNDLDIRIIAPDGFTEFLPWKLSASAPDAPAIKGDNIVDNIEKIEVDNAVGQYIIEVRHKGILVDLKQDFTIVVSGVAQSDFTITTDDSYRSICANEQASFDITINSIDTFNGNVTLSDTGLPPSFSTQFSPNTISGQGSSVLTIDNLMSQPVGDYPFTVTATDGVTTKTFDFLLTTQSAAPLSDLVLSEPINAVNVELSPVFSWDPVIEADSYELQISTTADFSNIVFQTSVNNTSYEGPELDAGTIYHWRVRPIGNCVNGNYSFGDFTTKYIVCEPPFAANNLPLIIPGNTTSTIQSVINVPTTFFGEIVADVNVDIDITHDYLSDLIITLTSPSGTTITLLEEECGSQDDMNVIFDDKGTQLSCSSSGSPALSGLIIPIEKLSAFYGENMDGNWTLEVEDIFDQDGGTINVFDLQICYETTLSTQTVDSLDFTIYPNPTQGKVNIRLNSTANLINTIQIYDINGRLVESTTQKAVSNLISLDLEAFQNGLYFVKISNENASTTKKLVIN